MIKNITNIIDKNWLLKNIYNKNFTCGATGSADNPHPDPGGGCGIRHDVGTGRLERYTEQGNIKNAFFVSDFSLYSYFA